MDINTKEVFYDKLTYIYVELANFHKDIDECKTLIDKWLFCLKNLQNLLERPTELQGRVFEKLFKTAEIAMFKPMELKAYEQSIHAYRDIKNGMDSARREGEAKGEFKANMKVARMMKAKGFDVSLISELTGLSEDQIAEL